MAKTQEKWEEEEQARLNPIARRRSYDDLFATLPLDESWWGHRLRKYQQFWFPELALPFILSVQETFKARPSDILLVSQPKSGTTWLKALAFAILNRNSYSNSEHHPLLNSSPHECVPFLRSYYNEQTPHVFDDSLDLLPSPRLIAFHHSYSTLPDSVIESGCRIIYLARDPKDTLVSHWHFFHVSRPEHAEPLPFDKAFELFCRGLSFYGPAWEHQLEYWQESVKRPESVVFFKYEEMTACTAAHVRRLAQFMGCPFSEEEEKDGVVEEIVRLCSFETLSNVEANRTGDWRLNAAMKFHVKNSSFFRKGKVGDWRNHMSLDMAKRLDDITQEKFRGSGLSFPKVID